MDRPKLTAISDLPQSLGWLTSDSYAFDIDVDVVSILHLIYLVWDFQTSTERLPKGVEDAVACC